MTYPQYGYLYYTQASFTQSNQIHDHDIYMQDMIIAKLLRTTFLS